MRDRAQAAVREPVGPPHGPAEAPAASAAAPDGLRGATLIERPGVRVRLRQSGEEGGASILDIEAEPGFVAPRHALLDSAVTLVVSRGALALTVEGRTRRVAAGQSATIPSGVPHLFGTTDEGPSRHLHVVATPGLERALRELAQAGPDPSPLALRDLARRHRIAVRGPAPEAP